MTAASGPRTEAGAAPEEVEPEGEEALAPAVEEPRRLLCPITHVMYRDPVFTMEGHTYDRPAISAYWRRMGGRALNPLSNQELPDPRLVPNWDKRGEIQVFLDQHPGYVPVGWTDRSLVPPPTPPSRPRHVAPWPLRPVVWLRGALGICIRFTVVVLLARALGAVNAVAVNAVLGGLNLRVGNTSSRQVLRAQWTLARREYRDIQAAVGALSRSTGALRRVGAFLRRLSSEALRVWFWLLSG
jgi:hypothetical protein